MLCMHTPLLLIVSFNTSPPPLATLLEIDASYVAESDQPSQRSTRESYLEWLPAWMSHLSNIPAVVLVPPEAANITTPLKHDKWQLYLSDYPDAALTKFFITGITQGFRLGYNSPLSSLKSARKNLDGTL